MIVKCIFCQRDFGNVPSLREHSASCEDHPLFMKLARLWEHLDDIERQTVQSEDADATLNAIGDSIEWLRKNVDWKY